MTDSGDASDQSPPDASLDELFEYCATCGASLPKNVWCPVVTETGSEGAPVLRSFCDDACKDAWTDGDD